MRARNGPGADIVVNIQTESDVGQWLGKGTNRVWTYTLSITVGLSPETYVIPFDGTPAFGVTARLKTPNPDREDELACLITLAARTALGQLPACRPPFVTDGSKLPAPVNGAANAPPQTEPGHTPPPLSVRKYPGEREGLALATRRNRQASGTSRPSPAPATG